VPAIVELSGFSAISSKLFSERGLRKQEGARARTIRPDKAQPTGVLILLMCGDLTRQQSKEQHSIRTSKGMGNHQPNETGYH
jgi:hypothetical protein